LLDEFEQSGLSGNKFAALSGIKYQTFACWVQGRRRKRQVQQPREARPAKTQPGSWLEAVVQEASDQAPLSRSRLTLHLPGGAHLELASTGDIPLAAALVRALGKPC
jgi:hypothetical protein